MLDTLATLPGIWYQIELASPVLHFFRRLFSVGPLPVRGDSHTIDVMKSLPSALATVTCIPTLSVVMTPGDWAGNRTSLALGQSGHRISPFRTDRLDDWLEGRNRPMPWGGPAPEQTMGLQRLLPGS